MIQSVKVKDCCKIVSGSTPSRNKKEFWGGEVNWFTPKDLSKLTSKYVYEAPEKISESGFQSCSTNMLPVDSLLLSSRAPIGHIAINKVEACTNQGFKSLIPNDDVDVEYLYYAIKRIVPQLQDLGNGATFKELSKSSFETVEIPLPPLEVQKKIAAILDAADLLRQKDKALIAKYDDLAQSLFLDMFGDPVTNPKGWEKVELKVFGKISTGNTPSRKTSEYYSSEHTEWIKTDNIVEGKMFITKASEYLSKAGALKGRVISKGGILVACIAGSVDSIGRCAIANRQVAFNQQMNAVLPNEDINSLFLYSLIKKSRSYIQDHASKGMKRILSKSEFEKIKFIKPPLLLQNQFAELIEAIEKQKQLAQASLKKSEDLFNSLLQRAFKGELV